MGSALRQEEMTTLNCGGVVRPRPPRPSPPPAARPPPSPSTTGPPAPRPPPPPSFSVQPTPPLGGETTITLTVRDHGESVKTLFSSSADHIVNGFASQKSAATRTAPTKPQTMATPSSFRTTYACSVTPRPGTRLGTRGSGLGTRPGLADSCPRCSSPRAPHSLLFALGPRPANFCLNILSPTCVAPERCAGEGFTSS